MAYGDRDGAYEIERVAKEIMDEEKREEHVVDFLRDHSAIEVAELSVASLMKHFDAKSRADRKAYYIKADLTDARSPGGSAAHLDILNDNQELAELRAEASFHLDEASKYGASFIAARAVEEARRIDLTDVGMNPHED